MYLIALNDLCMIVQKFAHHQIYFVIVPRNDMHTVLSKNFSPAFDLSTFDVTPIWLCSLGFVNILNICLA